MTVRRLCALALGFILLAAAWPKIADPPGFAQTLFNYRLVPEFLRHGLALVLPWLELWLGVALISGRGECGAARWAFLLMLAFAGAIALNLLRGNPIDCGCFGVGPARTAAEKLVAMRWEVLRDLAFAALALPLLKPRA
ncbi:MAG TPA: MauE/DoxX family redox-associated membrane protein [Holophagaceae bacterium]|nr:MauE/DoxX family redox-associated membrane protein [Holophagaceae bacterium]